MIVKSQTIFRFTVDVQQIYVLELDNSEYPGSGDIQGLPDFLTLTRI